MTLHKQVGRISLADGTVQLISDATISTHTWGLLVEADEWFRFYPWVHINSIHTCTLDGFFPSGNSRPRGDA